MKKILKTFCAIAALPFLLTPLFAAGLDFTETVPAEIEKGCVPPGCIEDYGYYACLNPAGNINDVRVAACPVGTGVQSFKCIFSGGIGGVGYWQPLGSCDTAVLPPGHSCLTGYVYDPASGKCRLKCDDGKFVDNKSECCTSTQTWNGTKCEEIVQQVCPPGVKSYQTCEKNGVDCGTKERTCSPVGQWLSWGECKVL